MSYAEEDTCLDAGGPLTSQKTKQGPPNAVPTPGPLRFPSWLRCQSTSRGLLREGRPGKELWGLPDRC